MAEQSNNPGGRVPGSYFAPAPGSPYAPSGNAGANPTGNFSRRNPCCTSPEQVFGLAASLAVFLRARLTTLEVQTLINLLTLIVSNLATMVIQEQLCKGIIVTPPES